MNNLQYSIAQKIDENSDGTLDFYIKKYNISSRIEYLEADDLDLISLEGGDKILDIQKHFGCTNNKLTNLIGGPQHFRPHAGYYCGANPHLISLEGAPLIIESFYSDNNKSLQSLEGIGRKYLQEVKWLNINGCNITKNILGLCLIKNKNNIVSYQKEILKMMEFQGEVLEAQEWLIENNFKELAKL